MFLAWKRSGFDSWSHSNSIPIQFFKSANFLKENRFPQFMYSITRNAFTAGMMPCLFRAVYASVTSFFFNGLSCLRWGGPGTADAKSVNDCPKRTDLSNQMSMFIRFFTRWSAAIYNYYLITLSAWTRTCCGITRPICREVLRLIKISNLEASFTGRSPGLAPFRMSTTYSAARRNKSARFAP